MRQQKAKRRDRATSSRYTVVAGEPVAVFYILGSPASCRVTLSLPLGLPVHS